MGIHERLQRMAADNVDWEVFYEAMLVHTGDDEFVEGCRADVQGVGGNKMHDEDDVVYALRGDDLENGFGYLVGAAEEDLGLTLTVPQTQVACDLYGRIADELGYTSPEEATVDIGWDEESGYTFDDPKERALNDELLRGDREYDDWAANRR